MDAALGLLIVLGAVAGRVILRVIRKPAPPRGLEVHAQSRDWGYRRGTHGGEVLEIESHGIDIEARRFLEPGLTEPTAHWSMRAKLDSSVPGKVVIRKRRDADGDTALGHDEFDALFVVESELGPREIKRLLDTPSLEAMTAFGEELNLSYEGGTLWLEWSDLAARSPQHLDDAITVVTTLGRKRPPAGPYRGGED